MEVNIPKLSFALLLLSYIVWWFYALITTIIPWLNVALSDAFHLTLLQIIASIAFFTGGSFTLVICIAVLIGLYVNW